MPSSAGGPPGASGSQFGLRRSALLLAATGCMGIVGQIVVLREMMAAYGGNELCAGVTLAVWMLSEALGAWSVGRAGKRRPVVGPLLFLSVLCSLAAVPAALLLRPLLGVLPGETLSIPLLLPATVLVALPPAATHGALFVTVAAAHAQYASVRDSSPSGVGSAYVWEGVGTAVAGLVCFLLLNHLSSLSLVALAALLLTAAGAYSSPMARPERTMLGAGAGVLALAAILALGPTAEKLAWARAWRGQRVTELTNSAYGKMTRLERAGQQFILYNGRPALTMPLLETERREELGLIPVLAHPLPRRVLVLGHDLALAVTMARCFAEVEVTAVQLDPLLAQVLRAALASESQLPPNLHLLVADPVSFLSSGRDSFDCLVLTDAVPLSLGDCRLFTSEFYRLCRSRLSSRGLLATSCPGSPTGLSPDLLGLLSTRRRTLEVAFEHVLPLAVDFPLLLASRRPVQVAGEDLVARLGRLACRPRLLDSGYVVALLAPFRQQLFQSLLPPSASSSQPGITRIGLPRELFLNMVRENRLASPWFGARYAQLDSLSSVTGLAYWLLGALLLAGCLAGARLRGPRFGRGLAILTSGFTGAVVSSLLLFIYQVRFGSVYSALALLVTSFMFGAVLGGALGTRRLPFASAHALLAADAALAVIALATPALMQVGPAWVFLVVNCLAGACLGFQFSLAGAGPAASSGRRAGLLTALDLLGGALGGLATALVVVPVLGITAAALCAGAVKLISALVQTANPQSSRRP